MMIMIAVTHMRMKTISNGSARAQKSSKAAAKAVNKRVLSTFTSIQSVGLAQMKSVTSTCAKCARDGAYTVNETVSTLDGKLKRKRWTRVMSDARLTNVIDYPRV